MGSCSDPDEEQSFFIVGASKGVPGSKKGDTDAGAPDEYHQDTATRAFVGTVSTLTLDAVWTKMLAIESAPGALKGSTAAIFCGFIPRPMSDRSKHPGWAMPTTFHWRNGITYTKRAPRPSS